MNAKHKNRKKETTKKEEAQWKESPRSAECFGQMMRAEFTRK